MLSSINQAKKYQIHTSSCICGSLNKLISKTRLKIKPQLAEAGKNSQRVEKDWIIDTKIQLNKKNELKSFKAQ